MTPRPRKRTNKGLPPNLYTAHNSTVFRYRHPQTGKFHGMGADKAKAINAAKQLNSILMSDNDLVGSVMGCETVETHCDWFNKHTIPEREYQPNTIGMYERRIKKLISELGSKPIEDVTVQDIATIMDQHTPRAANQFRQVAVDVFRVALSRGLCADNPAEITLKRKEKKARRRLTLDQFKAIHKSAPNWLKNAMDLALITLQRREDITLMKFEKISDGRLKVIQGKTQKHDTGYLSIKVGPKLEPVIKRCRDDIASPFLVHRKPDKKIKREGMEHWTQIKPEMVTRQFKETRDELEIFEGTPEDGRPTFHEIRALGIKLYKDSGINPQQLAGHSTEKMTKNYDSDHEDIRWMEVSAELDY